MVSKMYLIRVLFFVGDVRFNVRGEHVPGCLSSRAEYRPLKPHRDVSRYGKCISQCVLNISYKQESQFSISYRSQNLLH